MQTRTIPPAGYKKFFDSLSRVYDGSSATFEVLDPELGDQHEIDEQPLRGVSYDRSGLELFFVARDGSHVAHRIPHPKRVEVEEGDTGLIEALAIDSDDEPRAIVRFHPPIPSKLLPAGEAQPTR
jgi:hypothetical protein